MLLLVTLLLVVASAILLVLGFVQSALGFIYLSMVCAGVAALALIVFARLARRRSVALAGTGVMAGRSASSEPPWSGPEAPAAAVARPEEEAGELEPVDDRWDQPNEDKVAAARAYTRAGDPGSDDGMEWADWGDEVVFPIEDYDRLRVAEILPLLSQLEPDELQEVRDRELAGKARSTVLDRIDNLKRRGASGKPAAKKAASAQGPAQNPPTGAQPSEAQPSEAQPAEAPGPTKKPPARRSSATRKSE